MWLRPWIVVAAVACSGSSAAFAQPSSDRFLIFPLSSKLYPDGAYTAGKITALLDHSLKQNANKTWQYSAADGRIVGFNGEVSNGAPRNGDPLCLKGRIYLRADHNRKPMTTPGGCVDGYASYEEHPGYDYRASTGTPVYAAAAGTVVRNNGNRCLNTNLPKSCEDWGFLGIDHGNNIITQYGHLSRYCVKAGASVNRGQLIGYSGSKAAPGYSVPAHFHFEVLYKDGREYVVVDPYGWTGPRGARDPLYSRSRFAPRNMWSVRSTRDPSYVQCPRS